MLARAHNSQTRQVATESAIGAIPELDTQMPWGPVVDGNVLDGQVQHTQSTPWLNH